MVFQSNARPSSACQVAGFHRAIGRRLPQRPALLDAAELVFRMTLLGEEMAEVQQAAAELGATLPGAEVTDVFPLAHELIDLLYVAYGALLALGVAQEIVCGGFCGAQRRSGLDEAPIAQSSLISGG